MKRGALREALQVLHWALRLHANDAEAWSSYGLALERAGRDSEAEDAYRQAIAVNAGHATSHENLGMLQLKRGALRDGYAHRDWRFSTPRFVGMVKPSTAPLWRGENLAGKNLFVWREQGNGDEIMFAACYGALSARAGRVTAQCDKRLLGLFTRSFPQVEFIAEGAPPPPHDAQIPAGTLLRRLRGGLAAFPVQSRYLTVEPSRSAVWRERLAALGRGLKIGLAWRSAVFASEGKSASVDVCHWGPFFNLAGAQFINIQVGDVSADLTKVRNKFGVDINYFPDLDLDNDLDGAAALMSALDLVLSPAVSAADLAAAVGTPTWRLAPRDWTCLGTAVRPSYPAMRNWSPPPGGSLAQTPVIMAAALRRMMEGRSAVASPVKSDVKGRMKAAVSAFDAGQIAKAAAAFTSIIADDPQVFSAWAGLGACRAQLGESGAAVMALARGLSLNPADPAALTTLGNVAAAMGRHGDAVKCQQRAVHLAPRFFPAWDNLGVVLLTLGRDGDAARCHRQALAGMADSIGAWSNYAAALRSLGRYEAAREALGKALALAPDDPGVFACLTQLLRRTEPDPLANPWMGRAMRLAPAFPAIAFNHGLEMLRVGRLAEGLAGYERRFDAPELAFARPDLPGAPWRGENLRGKRLLVWGEQGVGDQLFFASVLPDLFARAGREGGRAALAFDPRLAGLLASSFPDADIVADMAAAGRVDYHCGVGSLATFFRKRLAHFPGDAHGYLKPDPVLAEDWRRRVAALPAGLRVGVAWRSGLITGERSAEYFQLTDLAQMLRAPQIIAINLQYESDAETAAATSAGMRIFQWPDLDLKNDFSAVAALIAQLDLVIAPATSAAELSAALGASTWRLSSRGDWTRLGVAVRPWLPAQKIILPQRGETMRDLSRRIAKLLAEPA
ncbi:MAG TPA: tetratricopeptide repeat protein [Azospirillaceae bacterium]|nr:tetratricopeptide repeat protein [Azospirillaceae bacterium]